MTPTQEKDLVRKVKDLISANEALDAKQAADIKALQKRVKALESATASPAKNRK